MSFFQSLFNLSDLSPMAKPNQASFKARKTLSLKGWKEGQPSLNLNKRTIQIILRKHRSPKVPEGLLEEKKSLLYGICSNSLCPSGRKKTPYGPREIYGTELTRYKKILKNSRNIQTISMGPVRILPLKLLQTFPVLRSLHSLSLNLTVSQLRLLSRNIRFHQNLRQLSVSFAEIEDSGELFDPQEEAEHALSSFLCVLLDLQHLKILNLSLMHNEAFNSGEVATVLFKGLSPLILSDFTITLPIPNTEAFKASEGQGFFAKVESLLLSPPFFSKQDSLKKKLVLGSNEKIPNEINPSIPVNFSAILKKCSSLQYLLFDPQANEYKVPVSFGLAKDLKSIECVAIDFRLEQKVQIAEQLEKFFSKAEKLEHFKFFAKSVENGVEFIIPIHRALENLCLRSYSFDLRGYFEESLMEIICEQLSKIKTVEKIDFELYAIEDLRTIHAILDSFPKIKRLGLRISNAPESVSFPVEKLAELESIEELDLKLPKVDKENFLQRFPKLPCLKKICVEQARGFFRNDLFTIEDYKKKFNL